MESSSRAFKWDQSERSQFFRYKVKAVFVKGLFSKGEVRGSNQGGADQVSVNFINLWSSNTTRLLEIAMHHFFWDTLYQTWIWRQPCATRHRISLFKAFARSLRHLWKCRLCNDFHTNIKMIYKERVPVQVFHVLIVLVFHPIRNRHRARNCEFHLIIDSLQVMFPHKGGSRSTWIYVER